jgi:hypothetical protein
MYTHGAAELSPLELALYFNGQDRANSCGNTWQFEGSGPTVADGIAEAIVFHSP